MPSTKSLDDEELVVLVVEDDDQDFFLLQRRLRQAHDVRFVRVATVVDGLTVLAEKNVNLVLLDLSLPDSKGLDTVTHIVSKSSSPVVVLTATDDEKTGLQALHKGAQDYLVKGNFDNALLTRTIRYAVERYKLLDELNESRELIRRERELRRLNNVSVQKPADTVANLYNGGRSLKERGVPVYRNASIQYSAMLDNAMEQRGFKVDNQIPQQLNKLADLLGSWRAAPRDVVEIHSSVLEKKLEGMESGKSRVCNEEARYLLTGVLGHLCSYYSERCEILPEPSELGASASNDSDIDPD